MTARVADGGAGRVAARGGLGEQPWPRLLYQLLTRRVTGRLVVASAGARTELPLRDGMPIVSRATLLALFAVRDGTFEVVVDVPVPAGQAIDPRLVIYPGIRAAYDDARLRAELKPLGGFTFRLRPVAPATLQGLGFPGRDATIETLAAAWITVDELGGRDARAVALALLYLDLLETELRTAADVPPAPVVPAPAAAPDPLRASITALIDELDGLSDAELLGVPETASPEEVNAAYVRAARQYHPDRLSGAGLRDLVPAAERLMARLTDAAAALSRPRTAGPGHRSAEAVAAQSIVDAERVFQRGEAALKKGDHPGAVQLFVEATRMNPAEPQYRAYLAWARWADPRAAKDALARDTLKVIDDVTKTQERFAIGHLWMGQIRKALGETDRAARAFKEALARDPNLLEAERELRLIQMRKDKPESGVFGKLFKK